MNFNSTEFLNYSEQLDGKQLIGDNLWPEERNISSHLHATFSSSLFFYVFTATSLKLKDLKITLTTILLLLFHVIYWAIPFLRKN